MASCRFIKSFFVICFLLSSSCLRVGFIARVDSDSDSDIRDADSSDGDQETYDSDVDDGNEADSDGEQPLWVGLGGSDQGLGVIGRTTSVVTVCLALDSQENPHVAWSDDHTGTHEIYLKYWDGTEWTDLDGSAENNGISNSPDADSRLGSLVINGSDQPSVVWMEHFESKTENYRSIFFRHWNGSTWQQFGRSTPHGGISRDGAAWWPSMAIDSLGRHVAAWEVNFIVPHRSVVHLRFWDGSEWVGINGSDVKSGLTGDQGSSSLVHLATGQEGEIYAVWQDVLTGSTIRFAWFDGTEWLPRSFEESVISPDGIDATFPQIALDPEGRPVVTWQAIGSDGVPFIQVFAWDGTTWQDLGDPALEEAELDGCLFPRIVVDQLNRPIIAYSAVDSLGSNIYIRRWEDGMWTDVEGSVRPGGLSNSAATSLYPHLAISHSDRLSIIWEEEIDAESRTALFLIQQ